MCVCVWVYGYYPVLHTVKRRSLTIDEVEGLELDPNLEEPLKAKLRRESRQGFYIINLY